MRGDTCGITFKINAYQLTMQGFSNYSGNMESDLTVLEEKVAQLIALCHSLRSENLQLRQELAHAQNDTRQLKEQMAQASDKLEALIERLPGESIREGVL